MMSLARVRARCSATPISTVEQGGDAILRLVQDDDVADKSGLFFDGKREARAHAERARTLALILAGLGGAAAVVKGVLGLL